MNTTETKANSCAVSVPKPWAVHKELEAWRQGMPQPIYDAAERVLMSLAFCARQSYLGPTPIALLADDVELLRQAVFPHQ